MTLTLRALGVSPGVATAPAARMAPTPTVPPDTGPVADAAAALATVRDALDRVAVEFEKRASTVTDKSAADVLAAQAMMARDPMLQRAVADQLAAGRSEPSALAQAIAGVRATFEAAGGYLAERAADLDDIRDRAVAELLGVPMPGLPDPGHPHILVASDLAPADTALLDPGRVLGIVTERGGPTSHTAILAKSLGIPAVVACADAARINDGDELLLDGATGAVVVAPDPGEAAARVRRYAEQVRALADLRGPGRTADGHPVTLLVNIGEPRDVDRAAAVDSEGVGLFRTEFLFLDRSAAPTADEQYDAYRRVFDAFVGRKVVVRTLDAGADKPLAYLRLPDEPNPALGVRGLRVSREHPHVLDEQLAALARAAADSGADAWVMAPMVATAGEAAEFVDRAHAAGLPVAGVMVEVPAAALRAHTLAPVCDFFSLGTNDLAQYTMATDRMAGTLADLLDPWQPAVLDLVAHTADAAAGHGKPVGVCGEAASDPLLALVLVGLGVASLSMAPRSVAAVRAGLSAHTRDECTALAGLARAAHDAEAARAAVAAAARL